jgi:hypothetical protein
MLCFHVLLEEARLGSIGHSSMGGNRLKLKFALCCIFTINVNKIKTDPKLIKRYLYKEWKPAVKSVAYY